jgi:hypothetical protein
MQIYIIDKTTDEIVKTEIIEEGNGVFVADVPAGTYKYKVMDDCYNTVEGEITVDESHAVTPIPIEMNFNTVKHITAEEREKWNNPIAEYVKMGTNITVTNPLGGYKNGDTINVSDST